MKALIATATALLFIAGPSPAQRPASVIPVHLYSFGCGPSPISLRAGVPVTMVFTDDAGIGHEFKAPGFFRASKIVGGQVGEDGAVELQPHQSMSVTLVPARGTYKVHCGHFMHTQMGMKSTIVVQ